MSMQEKVGPGLSQEGLGGSASRSKAVSGHKANLDTEEPWPPDFPHGPSG